jgi:hypothetical protein
MVPAEVLVQELVQDQQAMGLQNLVELSVLLVELFAQLEDPYALVARAHLESAELELH